MGSNLKFEYNLQPFYLFLFVAFGFLLSFLLLFDIYVILLKWNDDWMSLIFPMGILVLFIVGAALCMLKVYKIQVTNGELVLFRLIGKKSIRISIISAIDKIFVIDADPALVRIQYGSEKVHLPLKRFCNYQSMIDLLKAENVNIQVKLE